MRSRSDPRFVGSWSGQGVVDGTEQTTFTINFDEGGEAILTYSGQRGDPYFWRINDERLDLTYKGTPVARFGRALGRLFGVKSSATASLQITEASADSMVLDAGVINGKNWGWHLRRSEPGAQGTPSSPTEASPTPDSTNAIDGIE